MFIFLRSISILQGRSHSIIRQETFCCSPGHAIHTFYKSLLRRPLSNQHLNKTFRVSNFPIKDGTARRWGLSFKIYLHTPRSRAELTLTNLPYEKTMLLFDKMIIWFQFNCFPCIQQNPNRKIHSWKSFKNSVDERD